jgi:glycogen debranching enzyme
MAQTLVRWLLPALMAASVGSIARAAEAPGELQKAVAWLDRESHRMIRACRHTMNDGTTAFPPQVGSHYNAFWLRDYAYMLEGCRDAFTDQELVDACELFVRAQRADGACVDCIKYDGTPIYKPGYGTMGENPVADGSQFTVAVAWHTWQRVHDRELVRRIADRLVRAMEAVPRSADTGLVHIEPGPVQDRCPYGFTDAIQKQGDVLFASLLYVEAGRRLADLLEAAARPDDARHWRAEAERVAESIRRVFWDGDASLFRAATVQCNQPDVWGSAFAVWLGVATPEQALTVARYFKEHYAEIVQHGQVRHLPGGTYWEKTKCARDRYQNGGYWATATGWFVDTLDLVDPALADRTVIDLVSDFRRRGITEWCFGDQTAVPDYLASATQPLAGIRKVLERRKGQGPGQADRRERL